MTEIAVSVISAGVALVVAGLAHRRSNRAMRIDKQVNEKQVTNQEFQIVTDSYKHLVRTMSIEIDRLHSKVEQVQTDSDIDQQALQKKIDDLQSDM